MRPFTVTGNSIGIAFPTSLERRTIPRRYFRKPKPAVLCPPPYRGVAAHPSTVVVPAPSVAREPVEQTELEEIVAPLPVRAMLLMVRGAMIGLIFILVFLLLTGISVYGVISGRRNDFSSNE